jgi:hypothetical protein
MGYKLWKINIFCDLDVSIFIDISTSTISNINSSHMIIEKTTLTENERKCIEKVSFMTMYKVFILYSIE